MKNYKMKKGDKPGDLIKRHQEMVSKKKVSKGESLKTEKAELKLMKKCAKKK
jgi:hypothetical protein